MKLYAKTTSERASKGQGGNEYINMELYVHDRNTPIGSIELLLKDDTKEGCDADEWILNFYRGDESETTEPVMIAQGHAIPNKKGKKKKDDCNIADTTEHLCKGVGCKVDDHVPKGKKKKGEVIDDRRCYLCNSIEEDKYCTNTSCYEYTRYE